VPEKNLGKKGVEEIQEKKNIFKEKVVLCEEEESILWLGEVIIIPEELVHNPFLLYEVVRIFLRVL